MFTSQPSPIPVPNLTHLPHTITTKNGPLRLLHNLHLLRHPPQHHIPPTNPHPPLPPLGIPPLPFLNPSLTSIAPTPRKRANLHPPPHHAPQPLPRAPLLPHPHPYPPARNSRNLHPHAHLRSPRDHNFNPLRPHLEPLPHTPPPAQRGHSRVGHARRSGL
ncbi:hypothetical protein K440DRAFT_113240 [Wilcoxina mikolae CBS 423.85]|nr:hypothetical protein K440DRAFT_113240 [Wilcoxina mikolae CBS 423.85]